MYDATGLFVLLNFVLIEVLAVGIFVLYKAYCLFKTEMKEKAEQDK